MINTRLIGFNSDMITIIYKSGDQTVSLGDMGFYYVDFKIYQEEKRTNQKIPNLMTCLHYL